MCVCVCVCVCVVGILWAPGRNRHHSHKHHSFTHSLDQVLQAAAIARTRDYSLTDEPHPLLDPSCMLPGLHTHSHTHTDKKRRVGYYLHAKLAILRSEEVRELLTGVNPQDILYNSEDDITTVLDFLRTSEVVITSSYHGVLWATYLNIPVYTVFDFSEKFTNLPFTVRQYDADSFTHSHTHSLTTPYVNGIALKEKCIRENQEFYNTFVEPFVSVLHSLAQSPTPTLTHTYTRSSDDKTCEVGDDHECTTTTTTPTRVENDMVAVSLTHFKLSDVVSTVAADCSPLYRNHVYSKVDTPTYESNIYVEFDTR